MGHAFGKAKQGAEQKTDKDRKDVDTSKEVKALIKFMEDNYDERVKNATTFDEFYRAIYEMIILFCADRGQFQYEIPEKQLLSEQYELVKKERGSLTKDGNLSREGFIKFTEKIVHAGSFHVGRASIHVLMVLFGAPACALFAKRFVPGIKSLSDDVVIPAVTSGAVVYLAKTNKL